MTAASILHAKSEVTNWALGLGAAAISGLAGGLITFGILYAHVGANSGQVASNTQQIAVLTRGHIKLKAEIGNQGLLLNHLASRVDTAYQKQTVDEATIASIQATLNQINTRLGILVRRSEN